MSKCSRKLALLCKFLSTAPDLSIIIHILARAEWVGANKQRVDLVNLIKLRRVN